MQSLFIYFAKCELLHIFPTRQNIKTKSNGHSSKTLKLEVTLYTLWFSQILEVMAFLWFLDKIMLVLKYFL